MTEPIPESQLFFRLDEIEKEGGRINTVPVLGRIFKWIKYQVHEKEIQKIMNVLVDNEAFESRWNEYLKVDTPKLETLKKSLDSEIINLIFINPSLQKKIENIVSWAIKGEERIQNWENQAHGTINQLLLKQLDEIIREPIHENKNLNLTHAEKLTIFIERFENLCKIYDSIKAKISSGSDEEQKKLKRDESMIKSKLESFFYNIEKSYRKYQLDLATQGLTNNKIDEQMEYVHQLAEGVAKHPIEHSSLYGKAKNELVKKCRDRAVWWLGNQPNHPVSGYLKGQNFTENATLIIQRMISASGSDNQKIKHIDNCYRALSVSYRKELSPTSAEEMPLFEAAILACPERIPNLMLVLKNIDASKGTEIQKKNYENLMKILNSIEEGTGLP